MSGSMPPRTIEWVGGLDGFVRMIDQTKLPGELVMLECRDVDAIRHAIQRLSIRGAPAIGIAAAMGTVLGVRDCADDHRDGFVHRLADTCAYLATARPTAVNLQWAMDRMRRTAQAMPVASVAEIKRALLEEAKLIRDDDAAMCRRIGEAGRSLIRNGCGVLTHCNAGALATSELGTALAPLYLAHEAGLRFRVYIGETRPLLQGSRLTAWELMRAGIEVTLLCDGAIASLMKRGKIDLVITGADRIAANGDVANKIGTYGIALLARDHEIPFYIAAPSSTFDLSAPDGSTIPIEERDPDEIRRGFGTLTAPTDVACYGPAFDVTPAGLIAALITDRGCIQPVTQSEIAGVLSAETEPAGACSDT